MTFLRQWTETWRNQQLRNCAGLRFGKLSNADHHRRGPRLVIALARGRFERSESRDDDFLGEKVRIGIISNPANIVRILLCKIGVQVVQSAPHFICMLLIDAKHYRLGETICLLKKVREITCDSLESEL